MHGEHLEQVDLYLDFIDACYDATLFCELTNTSRWRLPSSARPVKGLACRPLASSPQAESFTPLLDEGVRRNTKIAHRIGRVHGGLGDVLGASVGGRIEAGTRCARLARPRYLLRSQRTGPAGMGPA